MLGLITSLTGWKTPRRGLRIFRRVSAFVFTVSEWVGPSWRTRAMVLAQSNFALGLMVLAGLAYGVRNWRLLQIIGTTPIFLLVFYFW